MSEENIKNYLKEYCDFVTNVTSKPSLDQKALFERMEEIESESNIKPARLLTAALGLGSEGGEFVEIVKKIFLQGKPFTEDNVFHMKRELGDIIWYMYVLEQNKPFENKTDEQKRHTRTRRKQHQVHK